MACPRAWWPGAGAACRRARDHHLAAKGWSDRPRNSISPYRNVTTSRRTEPDEFTVGGRTHGIDTFTGRADDRVFLSDPLPSPPPPLPPPSPPPLSPLPLPSSPSDRHAARCRSTERRGGRPWAFRSAEGVGVRGAAPTRAHRVESPNVGPGPASSRHSSNSRRRPPAPTPPLPHPLPPRVAAGHGSAARPTRGAMHHLCGSRAGHVSKRQRRPVPCHITSRSVLHMDQFVANNAVIVRVRTARAASGSAPSGCASCPRCSTCSPPSRRPRVPGRP